MQAQQERLKQRSSQRLTGAVGDRRARDARRTARPCIPRSRVRATTSAATSTCRRAAASACTSRRHGTFPLHHEQPAARRRPSGSSRAARSAYASTVWSSIVADPSADQPVPGLPAAGGAAALAAGDGNTRVPRPDPGAAGTGRRRAHEPVLRRLLPRRSSTDGQGIEAREHTAQVRPEVREEREDEFRTGEAAGAVLLADDGARRRHRRAERRQPAQRAADAGQLRAALRPRGPQRPAGAGVHVLLDAGTATTSTSSAAPSGWSPDRSRRRSSTSPTRTSSARTCTRSGCAETGARLGSSLTDILEVEGDQPTPRAARRHRERRSESEQARERTREARAEPRARDDRQRARASRLVERRPGSTRARRRRRRARTACDRWRGLYRSALATIDTQTAIITDASRSRAGQESGQAAPP